MAPGDKWPSFKARGSRTERGAQESWTGANHPGRLRFQSFRPNHPEPLTDAIIGQGKMSIGGGGYGGGGLPYPSEVLQLWGGALQTHPVATPNCPARGASRRLGEEKLRRCRDRSAGPSHGPVTSRDGGRLCHAQLGQYDGCRRVSHHARRSSHHRAAAHRRLHETVDGSRHQKVSGGTWLRPRRLGVYARNTYNQ